MFHNTSDFFIFNHSKKNSHGNFDLSHSLSLKCFNEADSSACKILFRMDLGASSPTVNIPVIFLKNSFASFGITDFSRICRGGELTCSNISFSKFPASRCLPLLTAILKTDPTCSHCCSLNDLMLIISKRSLKCQVRCYYFISNYYLILHVLNPVVSSHFDLNAAINRTLYYILGGSRM